MLYSNYKNVRIVYTGMEIAFQTVRNTDIESVRELDAEESRRWRKMQNGELRNLQFSPIFSK
jgi:hypothetical protein